MVDYIIVGAGSAGCVLANRLTEDPDVKVLLLEAGGPDKKQEVHIPAAFSKLFKGPCDWAFHTEPQENLGSRKLYWPRGKMLGGSSSMNAMIYIRGHRKDFDRWRDLGNEGWGFADVLPYFKKAEHQERGASEYHGTGGPLNVADQRSINPLSHAFLAAAGELGFPGNDDFNGAEQEGFGFYQVTQKGGKRCSAAAAYLKPALRRPNLTVHTQAQATRLILERNRAVGVEYVRNGRAEQARAGREVILSGGAIQSPQLLMLSGLGPAESLESVGISPVIDLPGVGQNLQDHLFVSIAYACNRPISLASAESIPNIAKYLFFRKGPLTSNVAEAGGFIRLDSSLPAPDLQFHFGPVYYLNHGFTRPEGHGFSIGPTLIRGESRGRITLRSSDPFEPPAIQPRYLDSQADLRTLVEGVKLACELAHTKAFADYRGAAVCETLSTAEGITEYIRNTVETIYHPAGTCKMGNDPLAVVDAQLRVRGVEGLRVVDASVMPELVGGNPNAVVIMLAEKAADAIRERP
ncbi:MAG TPA: choline dehydrogenase [Thermoanaerobaculia bacterium]